MYVRNELTGSRKYTVSVKRFVKFWFKFHTDRQNTVILELGFLEIKSMSLTRYFFETFYKLEGRLGSLAVFRIFASMMDAAKTLILFKEQCKAIFIVLYKIRKNEQIL